MAKRKARKITIRHPSQRQLVGTPPPYVRKKGPGEPLPVEEVIVDGKVVEKAPVKKVKTTPIAKPKPVKMESPSKKWYTGDDAKKVQNYALGLIEIKKGTNEFSRLDVNNDGKLTITDAMFVAQYVEDKVPRGPSGYSLNDANLVAKHMAGLIELPPELIAKFDANNDGKISISDAMVIKQAVKNETTPVPTPPLEPTPIIRKVGGYSWRLLENPDTGEKGWISRGIGTQYRYGGKEWDERYKGWTVLEDIGEVNPPKGAEYLPSGTRVSAGSSESEDVKPAPETKPFPKPGGIITPMERRRQEWLKTLLPGDTKTMPAKGTSWYNYIREGTPLPTGAVFIPVPIEPGIDTTTHPTDELKGGGGWRLIRNPQTQEEGWIQYGIGTQYKYGGKSWDGMYKDWKVVKEGRELEPPKDAELLYSGYNPPKTGYIPPLHKPGEPGITAGGYSSAPRTTKTTKKQVVKKKAKRTTARISSIGR